MSYGPAYETLYLNGLKKGIIEQPFNQYLKTIKKVEFYSISSTLWRGYKGTWEIDVDKLYLIGLQAYIKDLEKIADLGYFFPKQRKVFADWFSGDIHVNLGEILEWGTIRRKPLYEWTSIMKFENGVLIEEHLVDNHDKYTSLKVENEKNRQKWILEQIKYQNDKE